MIMPFLVRRTGPGFLNKKHKQLQFKQHLAFAKQYLLFLSLNSITYYFYQSFYSIITQIGEHGK